MRMILAILFFVPICGFILFVTGQRILSWVAGWTNIESIYFDAQDTKLMLVWAVVLLATISWFIWLESFQPSPKMKTSQMVLMAFSVSGILMLSKTVFADGYLVQAERYRTKYGYVVCDTTRYNYFGELQMVKRLSSCTRIIKK